MHSGRTMRRERGEQSTVQQKRSAVVVGGQPLPSSRAVGGESVLALLHPHAPTPEPMLFRSTLALAALSATALAAPAPAPLDSQVVLGQAGKAALDWSAGRLSRLGDDGEVGAMTQWGWYDCGAWLSLSCRAGWTRWVRG